jgi:hypothetical protein
MLETATTQTELQAAYQRAHEERAQAFRTVGRLIRAAFAVTPSLNAKRASQSGQPLSCDCPA